jgi:hypothetical protein
MTYPTLSIIDTTRCEKLDEMKSDGRTLGAMAIETSNPQLYLDNVAKNQVEAQECGRPKEPHRHGKLAHYPG